MLCKKLNRILSAFDSPSNVQLEFECVRISLSKEYIIWGLGTDLLEICWLIVIHELNTSFLARTCRCIQNAERSFHVIFCCNWQVPGYKIINSPCARVVNYLCEIFLQVLERCIWYWRSKYMMGAPLHSHT